MPAHREARALLQPAHVDIAFGEQRHIFGAKIGADCADDADRRKKARRQREVAGRPAQHVVGPALLSLDSVVGDRPDHYDAHSMKSAGICLIALLGLPKKYGFALTTSPLHCKYLPTIGRRS